MTRRKYRTRHIGALPLVVLDFPLAVKEVLYYAAAAVPRFSKPRHLTRKAFPDSLRSQSEIDIPPDGSPDCNRALGTVQES